MTNDETGPGEAGVQPPTPPAQEATSDPVSPPSAPTLEPQVTAPPPVAAPTSPVTDIPTVDVPSGEVAAGHVEPVEDEDDTIPLAPEPDPVAEEGDEDNEDVLAAAVEEEDDAGIDTPSGDILYPHDQIDFRGETPESLVDLIRAREAELGALGLDSRVRTVGTWENIMFRALMENSAEETRIQEALATLSDEEKVALSHRYPKEKGTKAVLRTASIVAPGTPGETRTLTGDAAKMAFEYQETGGGYRIPLYNTGITIDVIVPTGNNIQTLLSNCLVHDRELGSANGAHYFTYSDLMYKTQILNFLTPLIMGSSYVDWKKKGKLWSIIKLPDLTAIVAHLAAMCYRDGFEGFTTKCTRPISPEHPTICGHTETITANIFELIVSRFAAMSKTSIDFMAEARMGQAKHTLAQIAQYQAGLGLEGERLTFGNVTFTMRIPTLAEHSEAGSQFIADIINEIEADNTEGRYEHFGLRYIRTFIPFIATVEKKGPNDQVIKTDETEVIMRELEKLDQDDEDNVLKDALRKYINKIQLTYVGYPVIPCETCGYTGDTPSGMWTFDPFSTFFTLAFLYLKQPA